MNQDVIVSEHLSEGELNEILEESEVAQFQQYNWESTYYDASSMAPLSSTSAVAIERLRAYKPPSFPLWTQLPLKRRAAVLILLFSDYTGELRVVITMRATTLRNFAGHAAFPGGKADHLSETSVDIARRETFEEIGLPINDQDVPWPFQIEHLCELPCNLARTGVVVRPCVAFLYALDGVAKRDSDVEGSLIPRLDGREVAAVFSGDLRSFLRGKSMQGDAENKSEEKDAADYKWHEGSWTQWHGKSWMNHDFHVLVDRQNVAKPKSRDSENDKNQHDLGKDKEASISYRVWGMTARMAVDAARIAYGEDPDFDYNVQIGDEEIIHALQQLGHMEEKVQGAVELTEADWNKVRAARDVKGTSPSKI